jgi:hypothetical protein
VAHAIREQVDVYTRSLGLLEHKPGDPVANDELKGVFLEPVISAIRTTGEEANSTPRIGQLAPDEVERADREREREVRRRRRQTRARRQVTLPDRDPVRTHRTPVPRPGSSMPVPVMDENETMTVPLHELAQPFEIIRRPPKRPPPADEQVREGKGEQRPRTARADTGEGASGKGAANTGGTPASGPSRASRERRTRPSQPANRNSNEPSGGGLSTPSTVPQPATRPTYDAGSPTQPVAPAQPPGSPSNGSKVRDFIH